MKIYVATGWERRERVHHFMERVRLVLPAAELAYDWTEHTWADGAAKIGWAEYAAIEAADVFVALLPGGLGTHAELGAALAYGTPSIVVGNGALDSPPPCISYALATWRCKTKGEAIAIIMSLDGPGAWQTRRELIKPPC